MTATARAPDAAVVDEHHDAAATRHPTDLAFAVAAGGTAAIVAADGSLVWQIVRVLVALAVVHSSRWLHRRHRLGGIASATTGVVAIAIGLTFGPRYAAFGSWGLRALAGWVTLAAGLVLAVIGVARVARGSGRLPAAPVVVASLVTGILILRVITPALMATNVPPVAEGVPVPAGLDARAVTFASADGVDPRGLVRAVGQRRGGAAPRCRTIDVGECDRSRRGAGQARVRGTGY